MHNERAEKMMNGIFIALLIASVILVAVTGVLIVNAHKKNSEYRRCMGKIIGFYENTSEMRLSDGEMVAISPVVAYEVDGQQYEFVANFYSTSMELGDLCDVLYSPHDPSSATLRKGTVFAPIITGGIAVVLLVISLVFFLAKHKGIL